MRRRAGGGEPLSSPLLLIFLTVFLDLVGFGIIFPVLPIFARELTGDNEMTVGLLLASYSAMQFIFVPILGRLSDRVGRKPVLLTSVFGSCLAFLLMGYALLVHSLPLLFVSRILDGISGANISAAQAYIADVTTAENRAKGMGIIGAAFGLGFILGPAVAALLLPYGDAAPAFGAALLAGVNTVAIFLILPESLKDRGSHTGERVSSWQNLARIAQRREIALPILVFFFSQIAASMTQAAFPLFMSDPQLQWGMTPQQIAYYFIYLGLIVAIFQGGIIGRMVKKWGEVRVTVVGLVALTTSYYLFPQVTSFAMLYGVLAFMAFGQGSIIPSLNGLISRRSGAAEQGMVLGANQSMASLARVIGPLLTGWTYWNLSGPASYYTAGIFLVLALFASIGLNKS
ncbi:MAG: MFS transporter [Armatimonadetes bacterium]|nr:MFS transporter [Armatimonadota bacterium]